MPSPINITNIPAPRVDFIDPRTGLMAREWYRFFFNLFNLTGGGTSEVSLTDLQIGPPPINGLLGEFAATFDQAQLASMMAQYEEATRNAQNQLDTAPAAPQLGTLSAINEDNVRLLGFSTSPSPAVPNPAPTGTLYWDGNSTLGLQMNQSVIAKIGQAQFVYVKASAAITKGQLCKHTGSVGGSGVITAAPTSTSMTDTVQIIGVAAQNIALNGFGFVQVSGDLRGFDTTGSGVGETWADGDPLYYNPAYVGGLTKTKPSAPNLKTFIGEVINASSGGSGSINIHIVYGSTLGGTDSNVQFGTLADKDLIQYDSTALYWKNVPSSSIAIGTATNLAGGAAGSVPYQSGASTTTFLNIGIAAQVLQVNAGATAPEWVSSTGTGNVVRATSPALVTPLLGTPTSGNFSTGTFTWPTFNQNTTGTAANVTGTVAVANGGTGATTLTGYVFGNGTGAMTASASIPATVLSGTIAGDRGVTSGSTSSSFVEYNGTTATAGQFDGGVTVPTGSTRLNYGGWFYPTFLNLVGSADTATAATHYFVETATDGFVRPKTIANVRTEIVTNAAVLAGIGTLPVANGGTGTATAFTPGSVVFAGASGVYSQDNAQLFWDDTNNELGIGTATPTAKLQVFGGTDTTFSPNVFNTRLTGDASATSGNSGSGISFQGYTTGTTAISDLAFVSGVKENITDTNYAGALVFGTRTDGSGGGNFERMRIDSSGYVLAGTSSAITGLVSRFTNAGAGPDTFYAAVRYVNSQAAPGLRFGKSRGATVGAHAALASGDRFGEVQMFGSDGTNFVEGGKIWGEVDGAVSLGVMPGRLTFYTTPAGTGTATEKMRIDNAGNVGIGTATPSNLLSVQGNANFTGNVTLGDATTDTVTVSGYMAVGSTPVASQGLRVVPVALTGTTQFGSVLSMSATSAATVGVEAARVQAATAAAVFTTGYAAGLWVRDAILGAGSTITNNYGVYVDDKTVGTNNYGLVSAVSSGTNKWNIYASGTANNYFAGSLGIGTTAPTADAPLHIRSVAGGIKRVFLQNIATTAGTQSRYDLSTGTANAYSIMSLTESGTGNVTFELAAGPGVNTGMFFSSGTTSAPIVFRQSTTERMRIDTAGNVGIGTTAPSALLEVANSSGVFNYVSTVATSSTNGSVYFGQKARGAVTAPTAVLSGDTLVYFSGGGYNGTNYTGSRGFMSVLASENWTGPANGADVAFSATPTGATVASEKMRITGAGNVGIGTSTNLSTLTVNGSFASKSPSTVNAATYTVAATDGSLRFTTTNCTVTLPAAASYPGRILYLNTITANSVISASANVIPLGSNTAGTAILAATLGKFSMIQSDGTNWITMMAN